VVGYMQDLIAIVGRPNVGKSALFNRIVGRRIAIVHDMPGVTRDRVTAETEWRGRKFSVVDTGGIGLSRREKAPDVITRVAIEQVDLAIEAADLIILVVNVKEGVTPLDTEVAARLRQSGKRVVLAINKADDATAEAGVDDFAGMGFDTRFPVSAIHRRGIDDLMDAAVAGLPERDEADDAEEIDDSEGEEKETKQPFKIAIVGRPNVGKSSLINTLTESERVIVTDVPGTTRDAVDVPLQVESEGRVDDYVLIDTAGLRKRRRVKDTIEFFSATRTEKSIERCDLAVLVIDAERGVGEQDKKIADLITKNHKACIVVVNKWDLVEESIKQARREINRERRRDEKKKRMHPHDPLSQMGSSLSEFGEWIQRELFFLSYAPVIFSSAKTGFNLDRFIEAVRYVEDQLAQTIPTGLLNRCLRDTMEKRQSTGNSGQRLKLFYATQVKKAPPTFLLFINQKDLFTDQYSRFMEGEMRKAFGYEGCPLVVVAKPRPKKIESIRTRSRSKPRPKKVESTQTRKRSEKR
jgi:GTP-binding protein